MHKIPDGKIKELLGAVQSLGSQTQPLLGNINYSTGSKAARPILSHELFEAVEANRRGITPEKYNQLVERLLLPAIEQVQKSGLSNRVKGGIGAYIGMQKLKKEIKEIAKKQGPGYYSHYSPTVIMREAHMLPLLPDKSQAFLKNLREGIEAESLRVAGFDYNKPPAKLTPKVLERASYAPDLSKGLFNGLRSSVRGNLNMLKVLRDL